MKGENRWLETAQFEHAFWLQILGDHARFIYFAFPANERAYWQQAERFAERFDEQLQRAKSIGNDERRMLELTRSAQELAQSFRQFKLVLIRRQLVGTLRFHLSPAFVNHMLNELEEYLRLLNDLVKQQVPPPTHAVHHHLLWLLDATGHAGTIEKELEMTEYNLRSKSRQFTKDFEHFYLKAVEMAGFLRANLQRFPALSRFNREVKLEMAIFQEFLQELEEMEMHKTVLSTFTPLMADHMYREECYYLTKLAEVTELNRPDCHPAKPRVKQ